MKEQYESYQNLRNKIDRLTVKLEQQHREHLSCKMGCDLCCMDYSVFPVEFYSIRDALKTQQFSLELPFVNKKESCVFLKEHKCTIYTERPVICRTHGLPLLYMNEENEWELSTCELNFKAFDTNNFTNENTFPQDKFNSELFLINKDFISEFKEKQFGEFDLIPLRELARELNHEKA